MSHDCAFPTGGHAPITDTPSITLFKGGVCPLCLHDMVTEDACIECEHKFVMVLARYAYTGPLPYITVEALE